MAQQSITEAQARGLIGEYWQNAQHALTPAQTDLLAQYLCLLNHWNRVHSLTALTDPKAQVIKHVMDALAAWPLVEQRFGGNPSILVADVGCGMGVPGIVWAVVMPQSRFVLIERQQKKIAFLRHVVGRLGLAGRVQIQGKDVRSVGLKAPADLIVSRAFAALGDFVRLTWNLSGSTTQWAAMMGKPPEINNFNDSVRTHKIEGVMLSEIQKIDVPGLDADRHLVWLKRAE